MIINDELIPKNQFNKEYIEMFLKESTANIKLDTIITDGYRPYPEIIELLGAKHQLCTFHIMQNLMTKLNPYINTKKKTHRITNKSKWEKRSKNRRIKKRNALKKRKT